jgi:GNAT superfamily N-acetyltransferase
VLVLVSAVPEDAEMDGVGIRRATRDDADAIAAVYLASFTATYGFPLAHSDQQVRRWIAEILLPTEEVWVVTARDHAIVAMLALSQDMLDQLYVAPGSTGHGIGSRLIELAKSRRPGGLDLYTFQVNSGARRFYERHAFAEVARGDGSDNEEGQPDIRYAWRPPSQTLTSRRARPNG